jgi:hypothetical protein
MQTVDVVFLAGLAALLAATFALIRGCAALGRKP